MNIFPLRLLILMLLILSFTNGQGGGGGAPQTSSRANLVNYLYKSGCKNRVAAHHIIDGAIKNPGLPASEIARRLAGVPGVDPTVYTVGQISKW